MRRLVDRYEEVVLNEISDVGSRYGLSAYPKVRVADVIDLDKLGVDSAHKRFGLMAHFDFVICREFEPQYAVEFDGQSHLSPVQRQRDAKKDHLCELANLPILRINSRYLTKEFGDLTLLAWIMETYEMQCGFYEAQQSGQIPYDEPFDPFCLMTMKDGKFVHSLWLSERHRQRMRALHKQGRIRDFTSSNWVGENENGVLRGMEFIRVTQSHGLYVETAMRGQKFPIMFTDLIEEVLTIQLMDRIDAYLDGRVGLVPLVLIDQRLRGIQAKYKLLCSHSSSSPQAVAA